MAQPNKRRTSKGLQRGKFDPQADAGWPHNGYGLGQMTQVGVDEIHRFMKAGPHYPQIHHDRIVKGVGESTADAYRTADFEKKARGTDPYHQILTSITFLAVLSHRDGIKSARELFKTYGPPGASHAQYADVILNCAECLNTAPDRDEHGVPMNDASEAACKNCLRKADDERQSAYGK